MFCDLSDAKEPKIPVGNETPTWVVTRLPWNNNTSVYNYSNIPTFQNTENSEYMSRFREAMVLPRRQCGQWMEYSMDFSSIHTIKWNGAPPYLIRMDRIY